MNNKSLYLTLLLAIPILAVAQADDSIRAEEEVLAPVHRLFDGMRAGDSTMVRNAFDPIARLVTTFYRDGKPAHHITSIDDFAKIVGTPHDRVFDERIWDIRTDVRDNLASVWMKYAFFLDNDLSHCGVNSFELFATVDGWKIMHLADTRKTEDCEMPAEKP